MDRHTDRLALVVLVALVSVLSACNADNPGVTNGPGPNGVPYDSGSVIAGITFDWASHDRRAPGSDNFPITWADDDHQYTSWGDGGGFGGSNNDGRVSLGVARVEGTASSYTGININGGVNPESGNSTLDGKSYGILSLGGVLYMWVSPGSNDENWNRVDLLKSTNRGATWSTVIPAFVTESDGVGIPAILQFGRDYAGARDDFVYSYFISIRDATSLAVQRPGAIALVRAPRGDVEDRNAYEWFAGIAESGNAIWSPDITNRAPVFEDANGVGWNLSVVHNAGLNRYLLVTEHTESMAGNIGIFDAPEPWGPWNAVTYQENWPPGGQVEHSSFFWNFSPKWWSDGGLGFVLVFSGVDENDSWNTVRGSFVLPNP